MQRRTLHDVLFYCAAVFALAAITWFVLMCLAHALTFIVGLTENVWIYDRMLEFVEGSTIFSHSLSQILCLAGFYTLVHFVWKKLKRS